MHGEGLDGATAAAAFIDSSQVPHIVTVSGNVQIDTAQFQAGASSILFERYH